MLAHAVVQHWSIPCTRSLILGQNVFVWRPSITTNVGTKLSFLSFQNLDTLPICSRADPAEIIDRKIDKGETLFYVHYLDCKYPTFQRHVMCAWSSVICGIAFIFCTTQAIRGWMSGCQKTNSAHGQPLPGECPEWTPCPAYS